VLPPPNEKKHALAPQFAIWLPQTKQTKQKMRESGRHQAASQKRALIYVCCGDKNFSPS